MSVLNQIIDSELTIKERWQRSVDAGKDPELDERVASAIAGIPVYWFGNILAFLDTDSVLGDQKGRLYVLQHCALYRIDRRLLFGEKWVLIGEVDKWLTRGL